MCTQIVYDFTINALQAQRAAASQQQPPPAPSSSQPPPLGPVDRGGSEDGSSTTGIIEVNIGDRMLWVVESSRAIWCCRGRQRWRLEFRQPQEGTGEAQEGLWCRHCSLRR